MAPAIGAPSSVATPETVLLPPRMMRVGSAAIGFAAYLVGGKRMIVGIATAEALLCLGLWAGL